MKTMPQPWTVAMEATIFSGWIYDHLLPHATQIKVAHPLMLRAIAAAKKKNDQIDASKLADCLRCDFLPECHLMPRAIRDRRRTLRYRHLLVRQMVQMKNRVSGLLMETGVEYNKQRLHKVSYFRELLSANGEVPPSIRPLLQFSRETIERCQKTKSRQIRGVDIGGTLANGLACGYTFTWKLRYRGELRVGVFQYAGRVLQCFLLGAVERELEDGFDAAISNDAGCAQGNVV